MTELNGQDARVVRVCEVCKRVLPDAGIVRCCGVVYGEDLM